MWRQYVGKADSSFKKHRDHHRYVAWKPSRTKQDSEQPEEKEKVGKLHRKLRRKTGGQKKHYGKLYSGYRYDDKQQHGVEHDDTDSAIKLHDNGQLEYIKGLTINQRHEDEQEENDYTKKLKKYLTKQVHDEVIEGSTNETKSNAYLKGRENEAETICVENGKCQRKSSEPETANGNVVNKQHAYPLFNESETRKVYEEAEVKHEANVENQQTAEEETATEAALVHATELANDVARELNETSYVSPFELNNLNNFTKIDTARLHQDVDNANETSQGMSNNTNATSQDISSKIDLHQVVGVKFLISEEKQNETVDSRNNQNEKSVENTERQINFENFDVFSESKKFAKNINSTVKAEETDLTPEEKQKFENDENWSVESDNDKSNSDKSAPIEYLLDKSAYSETDKQFNEKVNTTSSFQDELASNEEEHQQNLIKNLNVLSNGVSSFVESKSTDNKSKDGGNADKVEVTVEGFSASKQSDEGLGEVEEKKKENKEDKTGKKQKSNKEIEESETQRYTALLQGLAAG